MIKPVRWVGAAREEIQDLPEEARKEVGFALWAIQQRYQQLQQLRLEENAEP